VIVYGLNGNRRSKFEQQHSAVNYKQYLMKKTKAKTDEHKKSGTGQKVRDRQSVV